MAKAIRKGGNRAGRLRKAAAVTVASANNKIETFLGSLAFDELQEVADKAAAMVDEKRDAERRSFMEEIREKAARLGIAIPSFELGAKKGRPLGKTPVKAKYRGPHGETWSGRGRQPRWMVALETQGHKRDEYLIK